MDGLYTRLKNPDIILYDGRCGICSGNVRFLKWLDVKNRILFLTLQSNDGMKILESLPPTVRELDSVILIHKGTPFVQSAAVIRSIIALGGFWKLFGIFLLLPSRLTDRVYRIIARNRYRFGIKTENCRIP